ncbi:MAG: HlyC/CorC family transporter [Treponema sp.]|nr:HlyC/CorC family transporter [Treponema sp.]MBR5965584.1 HlyC/CorC family transporter [Treponema sp.]
MNWSKIICTSGLLMFLVWLIAFFAGSETAFLSMTNIRVRKMLRAHKAGAKRVARLRSDMDSVLTVVLIGINFINTLASSIATALAIELVGNKGVAIATAAITFFVTVFGEIIPKTVAGLDDRTDKIAALNSVPLEMLKYAFWPVVWIFSRISKATAFVVEKIWKRNDAIIQEGELKTLIQAGADDGALEKSEKKMLDKILEISDLTVHNIMKHRSLVTYIKESDTRATVVEAFKNSGYSHLPVYKESKENVTGVLYYKDVLFEKQLQGAFFIVDYMSSPLYVPETFSVIELIQTLKKENRSFAVALDEQGATAGIVTLDDVMRGLFGRMSDAGNKHQEVPAEERIKIISSKEFLLPGDMRLGDLNAILNLNLSSENFDTLAGFLMEKFDSLPSSGEALRIGRALFVVEDQSQRRIKTVRIKF